MTSFVSSDLTIVSGSTWRLEEPRPLQQHGPSVFLHGQPIFFSDDSDGSASQVTKKRTSASIPALVRFSIACCNSSATHSVQETVRTTQTNTKRLTGSFWVFTLCAISRRIDNVNVIPVDPEMRRTVSKAAKSDWDPPYGPPMSERCCPAI